MRRTPALIVGGGPAGASTAIVLARDRLPHLLVERMRETGDALCGGFLSWRTLESLAGLGLDADALNPDPITHVRLFAGGRTAEARLPRPARCVSRRRLDTLLLARAVTDGAAIERGVTVGAIDGLAAQIGGGEIAGDALFLASGKHDIRGLARPTEARGDDPVLGIRVRLGPAPALTAMLTGAIELHLFAQGYVGLSLQEDGSANFCMAVAKSRLQAAGDIPSLLAVLGAETPMLADRLAFLDARAPADAIANVPYGWRMRRGAPGLFRLGDQAGVIPSLAGEGMGIAIASGLSAASAYRRGGSAAASAWQERFARDLARPIGIAGLVRASAESPLSARAMLPIARAAPALVALIARATRISVSDGLTPPPRSPD